MIWAVLTVVLSPLVSVLSVPKLVLLLRFRLFVIMCPVARRLGRLSPTTLVEWNAPPVNVLIGVRLLIEVVLLLVVVLKDAAWIAVIIGVLEAPIAATMLFVQTVCPKAEVLTMLETLASGEMLSPVVMCGTVVWPRNLSVKKTRAQPDVIVSIREVRALGDRRLSELELVVRIWAILRSPDVVLEVVWVFPLVTSRLMPLLTWPVVVMVVWAEEVWKSFLEKLSIIRTDTLT